MLPVLALVGRPNVGKSTLFNALTGTRDALVADFAGLTRDRLYGYATVAGRRFIAIDTGGLGGDPDDGGTALKALVEHQVAYAIAEADVVVLLVEATPGPLPDDHAIVARLRKAGKPVILAINKAEGREPLQLAAAFYELGLGEPLAISARQGDRLVALGERINAAVPVPAAATDEDPEPAPHPVPVGTRLAVIGRPNVGKSTLINRYLGEDRLLTSDEAGTTRDSIQVHFRHGDRDYVLWDTAGIRRKDRVDEMIERFSIVKSLQALEEADAVLVLIDARQGVTVQDVSLIGLALERGRALAIGINKWDRLPNDQRAQVRRDLDRRLPFLDFADVHFISALHGTAIYDLLESGRRAAAAAVRELPTPKLNQVLRDAVQAYPTPVVNRRRIKLTYAHQGGRRPPVIVIHGNQTDALPDNYRRYLTGCFRKAFRLQGTPIRLELKTGRNPFAGRRNQLTPRQVKRRDRVRARGKKHN